MLGFESEAIRVQITARDFMWGKAAGDPVG